MDQVFKGKQRIREAQVVQESLQKIMVYVVPGKGYGKEDENDILANLKLVVGDIPIGVKAVSKIPRTVAGKFRAVLCKLSPEERMRIIR
jgi:hypothetical protein